ncbi:MAG: membrane protein insertion efficiency factor YidD [Verrucomicrobiota bacterium]|nr:membrane protein insertion efficiency factor YidD [Verrucomicrobiota bacterium]
MSLYQGHIHQVTSRFVHCRFQPTCSMYSVIAMQTHGFARGSWLTVKRLCRCLPWVPFGTSDPVPPPAEAHANSFLALPVKEPAG